MRSVRSDWKTQVILGFVTLLAACAQTPTGSTVQVTPGPGKGLGEFEADMQYCRQNAGQAVAGQAEQANQRSVALGLLDAQAGMGDSANSQAVIQQQYDTTYGPCMYSRGNNVAGFPPVGAETASGGGGSDPMVRSVQRELIRLRYMGGRADGVMGARTSSAISSFEAARGMPVDGMPSESVLASLRATRSHTATASSGFVKPVNSGGSTSASAFVAPVGAAPAPNAGFVAPVQ